MSAQIEPIGSTSSPILLLLLPLLSTLLCTTHDDFSPSRLQPIPRNLEPSWSSARITWRARPPVVIRPNVGQTTGSSFTNRVPTFRQLVRSPPTPAWSYGSPPGRAFLHLPDDLPFGVGAAMDLCLQGSIYTPFCRAPARGNARQFSDWNFGPRFVDWLEQVFLSSFYQ